MRQYLSVLVMPVLSFRTGKMLLTGNTTIRGSQARRMRFVISAGFPLDLVGQVLR